MSSSFFRGSSLLHLVDVLARILSCRGRTTGQGGDRGEGVEIGQPREVPSQRDRSVVRSIFALEQRRKRSSSGARGTRAEGRGDEVTTSESFDSFKLITIDLVNKHATKARERKILDRRRFPVSLCLFFI